MRPAAACVLVFAALFGAVMTAESTPFVQGWMPALAIVVYGGLICCAAIIGAAYLRERAAPSMVVVGSVGGAIAMVVGLTLASQWTVVVAVAVQAFAAVVLSRPAGSHPD